MEGVVVISDDEELDPVSSDEELTISLPLPSAAGRSRREVLLSLGKRKLGDDPEKENSEINENNTLKRRRLI